MARKWKRPIAANVPETVIMIEHTISKYVQPVIVPTISTYQHTPQQFQRSALVVVPNNQLYYSKDSYDKYIVELQEKGFTVGREVLTKYGMPAKIGRFLECPIQGISFYTTDKPNVMYIVREDCYTSIAYNEEELKFVEITEGAAS